MYHMLLFFMSAKKKDFLFLCILNTDHAMYLLQVSFQIIQGEIIKAHGDMKPFPQKQSESENQNDIFWK